MTVPPSVVVPSAVDLTPVGQHVLITVDGQADLYVIDLEGPSINLVELAGVPSALAVVTAMDRTVITYRDSSTVEVMEHERFEVEAFDLDERMSHILEGDDFVVLHADNGLKDAYRLDLVTDELVEFRLENPPTSMKLAPTGEFAVAFTRPESGSSSGSGGAYNNRPGMEVLDLTTGDNRPYLLEGAGVGLAFVEADGRLDALILQSGTRYLYQLDLNSGDAESLDLDVAPAGLGTLPDGRFFITHTSEVGGISFLDPATGDISSQFGFAIFGALDPIELTEEDTP